MKALLTQIAITAALVAACAAGDELKFGIPERQVVQEATLRTNETRREGRFWTAWLVETNDTPTHRLGVDNGWAGWVTVATNSIIYSPVITTNYFWWPGSPEQPQCTKPHYEPEDHVESRYVQSNYVACLEWDGKVSTNYLESLAVRTEQRHWHEEKVRKDDGGWKGVAK